ncbi:amino acid transporter [Catenulispora sp. MAP12-49]|uniref:APC family permease n=1 Tax=Catenulispora sp. MAP12-49 TaxID=3156302 RepID=UPI003514877A
MTTAPHAEPADPPAPGHAAAGPAAHPAPDRPASTTLDKGLRAGALGLLSSIVIAVSSTAPAYSIAAILGLIVAISGTHTPGMFIVAFIPMLFIAVAFRELNRIDPDCGTTFVWVRRAFGPGAGWMGGWGIIAADIIVMASLAQVVGRYALLLVGADGLATQTAPVVVVGVVFIAALTYVCHRGIEISARLQLVLLGIEIAGLAALCVVAFVKVGTGHAMAGHGHLSASWLNPFTGSFTDVSNAFLLAVFVYWGWDAAVSVNEETEDAERIPGRSAVTSTLMLVGIFFVVAVATLAYAGPAFLTANSGDVLGAMADSVFGSTLGKIMILCVLSSTAASTQTTIMPTARAVLSMAAHGALPTRLGRVHPRYLTPSVATITMGVVSAVFYVLLAMASSNILADSASATGLLIAFYYGLTGLACVWVFRKDLRRGPRDLLAKGVLPLLGGLALFGAFALSIKSYLPASSSATHFAGIGGIFLIGAGALVLGLLLMLTARLRYPGYFRRSRPAATEQG